MQGTAPDARAMCKQESVFALKALQARACRWEITMWGRPCSQLQAPGPMAEWRLHGKGITWAGIWRTGRVWGSCVLTEQLLHHDSLTLRKPAPWGRQGWGRCTHLAGWITKAAGQAPVCEILHFALFGPKYPVWRVRGGVSIPQTLCSVPSGEKPGRGCCTLMELSVF